MNDQKKPPHSLSDEPNRIGPDQHHEHLRRTMAPVVGDSPAAPAWPGTEPHSPSPGDETEDGDE